MGTALIILLVLLAGTGLLVLFAVGQYNTLITLRNRSQNDFSLIAAQLKRRYDLISSLVETAKGSLRRERDSLEIVISARNSAYTAGTKAAADPGNPRAIRNLMGADAGLCDALAHLFAVAEAYHDLRTNQTMLQLSRELSSTEKKIRSASQAYNDTAMAYNIRREVFPANVIAGIFHFAAAELFQIETAVEDFMPKVSLT